MTIIADMAREAINEYQQGQGVFARLTANKARNKHIEDIKDLLESNSDRDIILAINSIIKKMNDSQEFGLRGKSGSSFLRIMNEFIENALRHLGVANIEELVNVPAEESVVVVAAAANTSEDLMLEPFNLSFARLHQALAVFENKVKEQSAKKLENDKSQVPIASRLICETSLIQAENQFIFNKLTDRLHQVRGESLAEYLENYMRELDLIRSEFLTDNNVVLKRATKKFFSLQLHVLPTIKPIQDKMAVIHSVASKHVHEYADLLKTFIKQYMELKKGKYSEIARTMGEFFESELAIMSGDDGKLQQALSSIESTNKEFCDSFECEYSGLDLQFSLKWNLPAYQNKDYWLWNEFCAGLAKEWKSESDITSTLNLAYIMSFKASLGMVPPSEDDEDFKRLLPAERDRMRKEYKKRFDQFISEKDVWKTEHLISLYLFLVRAAALKGNIDLNNYHTISQKIQNTAIKNIINLINSAREIKRETEIAKINALSMRDFRLDYRDMSITKDMVIANIKKDNPLLPSGLLSHESLFFGLKINEALSDSSKKANEIYEMDENSTGRGVDMSAMSANRLVQLQKWVEAQFTKMNATISRTAPARRAMTVADFSFVKGFGARKAASSPNVSRGYSK